MQNVEYRVERQVFIAFEGVPYASDVDAVPVVGRIGDVLIVWTHDAVALAAHPWDHSVVFDEEIATHMFSLPLEIDTGIAPINVSFCTLFLGYFIWWPNGPSQTPYFCSQTLAFRGIFRGISKPRTQELDFLDQTT